MSPLAPLQEDRAWSSAESVLHVKFEVQPILEFQKHIKHLHPYNLLMLEETKFREPYIDLESPLIPWDRLLM